MEVKSNGTIDESCEGKLQWDRDLRLAVPRFLDVSIISLQNQNPQEMNNLRVYMETKYKYVNHSVSDSGFNDCVLHQLDSERARLKQLYFGPKKQITCPKNAHPVAWRKLKAHWQDEEIQRKAQMKTGSEGQAVVPLHLLKAQLVSSPCLPPLVIPCHTEHLNQIEPNIEWYVVSCGPKDGEQKETRLCAQIMITFLGSVVNICGAGGGRRPI